MTSVAPPSIPWQVTGNHWLSLPCIHPGDASLHAVGIMHRAARAAVEFAGAPEFIDGGGQPLLRPTIAVNGGPGVLGAGGMVWERALEWLPTFTCAVGDVHVRGTIFAPFGRDADMPGAVYALALENRGAMTADITAGLHGVLGHRQQRVRTARSFDDAHRVVAVGNGAVVMEGAALPGLVALAIGADAESTLTITDGATPGFSLTREIRLAPGERQQIAFYMSAGPERDGAEATLAVLRRRGWKDLLTATRDAVQALQQTTGQDTVDRLINRNLLFAYFYAVGRALDDAHFYLVRSRMPWNGRGLTCRDWEALSWTLPAVQLADPLLGRELLLRMCEVHGYAPGQGVHYLDGTLFAPGFSIEGAAAYALAADRYIRETGDDRIVEEGVLADTLYLSSDDMARRRSQDAPLFSTEVTPSGAAATLPYTLHANAVVALALDVLRRTLDEETAKEVEAPDAVRAAILRHFVVDRDGKSILAAAIDLNGGTAIEDDPVSSALWLPLYETVERQDSLYRRTVKAIRDGPDHLSRQCARLIGPDGAGVLQWLRRAPLDQGLAAEIVDADGRCVANGGDAALAGLLAWCVWYSAHALGVRN